MANSKQPIVKSASRADIGQRGRDLQHRFRVAGFPQYTRWFVEHEPKWKGDSSLMSRIRVLFNGDGAMGDLGLLEKCEALADMHLKPYEAAA